MIENATKDSMGNESLMAIVAKYCEPKGNFLDGM
jgi:hypothetical protein